MHHHMPWSKTGCSSLNMLIFPLVMSLVLDDPKQWPPRNLLIKFKSSSGRPPDFGCINSWATRHITWAVWIHYSWRFGHAEALRELGPEMPERGSKTSTVPFVWAKSGIFSALSKWFPITIGDHGRNLVISLWTWDKAIINGVAAWRLTPPQKIPSAKICRKSSRFDFLESRRHPLHWLPSKGPNSQRGVLLISAGANEGHFEAKMPREAHEGGSCSCTTMPRLTG